LPSSPHVPLSWGGIHWVAELASEVMRRAFSGGKHD